MDQIQEYTARIEAAGFSEGEKKIAYIHLLHGDYYDLEIQLKKDYSFYEDDDEDYAEYDHEDE